MYFLKVYVPKTVVCVGAEDQLKSWGFSEVQRQSGSSTPHRLSQAVAKKTTPDLSVFKWNVVASCLHPTL